VVPTVDAVFKTLSNSSFAVVVMIAQEVIEISVSRHSSQMPANANGDSSFI